MAIKPDKWIRKMAQEHNMLDPFIDGQVKVNDKGEGAISYGLSSYGYDVRCSNEFKVFTNINSAT
ncbi:MAG: dCTP deaminase, partial [Ghiorsea sp.]